MPAPLPLVHDIDQVVAPPMRDLGGGLRVRRVLPAERRPRVGPFIFFDQMGPLTSSPGQGVDVRPHPHIGMAAMTWLLDGELLHRDSLGNRHRIQPGEVAWMTAGRGIVHSERSPSPRVGWRPLSGIQAWVALPVGDEEMAPSFQVTSDLPRLEGHGKRVRVLAGHAFGLTSPLAVRGDILCADAILAEGASLPVPAEHEERAAYVLEGWVQVETQLYPAGELLLLHPGAAVTLRASAGAARILLLGGAALEAPRHIWWNLVSSRPERIEQAKADWRDGRFPEVPGDAERMPLPD